MATSNSPNRQKHSTTSEAINGELEQSRQAVLKDANLSVPLVPVSYFKKSLLPRLRKGLDADEVVDKLRDVGHITPKGRLKVFKQSPSQTPGTEDSVFKSFGKVTGFVATQARYLLRKAKTNTKHTAEFCCNPTMTPQSTNRHSTSKPDSYGVLVNRTVCNTPKNAPHWDDIVVAGKKKKKGTIADVNDVCHKSFCLTSFLTFDSHRITRRSSGPFITLCVKRYSAVSCSDTPSKTR